MKIIWLMPECPYPANTGGRVGVWNRIKVLGKSNDIYLFIIADSPSEINYKTEIEHFCQEVRFYVRHISLNTLFKSMFYPYPAVSRWNKNMKNDIETCYKRVTPDLVMVEYPQMLGNLPDTVIKNAKIILNQHNIEHLSMASIANHTDNIFRRIIYKIAARQLKHYEQIQYKNLPISVYTFVSEIDKKYFENNYGIQNTLLVPAGADVQELKPAVHSKIISFIAKMSYEPNETGAIWFIENVWNRVTSKIPDAELFLVGKDPSEKLIKWSRKYAGITITGTVDSVEPYYEKSAVIIVPILSGGGVKVKLLEGLGYGKIVITTNKGIEGMKFISGQHVLAADSPNEFADLCVSAMNHPEQYDMIRTKANSLMKEQYSWTGIMNKFEKQLREMCEDDSARKKTL